MIGGHRVVAVVTARAGSKTIPHKNLQLVGGKPLVAWPIDVALATPEIDRIVVSTDGDEIAAVARERGAEVAWRPVPLGSDTALVADVLRDLIATLRVDGETARYLVLLEPTAPFRRPEDIRACLTMLDDDALDSVATFTEAELNPHRAWCIDDGGPRPFIDGAVPWQPRQLLPRAYQLNGAVYAFVMDLLTDDQVGLLFGRSGAVIMDRDHSLDIDDALYLQVANALAERDADA